jgi:hypothetical protein
MMAKNGEVALQWQSGGVTIHFGAERTFISSGRRYDRGPKRCMGAMALVTHVPQSTQNLLQLPPKGRGFDPPNWRQ